VDVYSESLGLSILVVKYDVHSVNLPRIRIIMICTNVIRLNILRQDFDQHPRKIVASGDGCVCAGGRRGVLYYYVEDLTCLKQQSAYRLEELCIFFCTTVYSVNTLNNDYIGVYHNRYFADKLYSVYASVSTE
jgi:hypothetical protein